MQRESALALEEFNAQIADDLPALNRLLRQNRMSPIQVAIGPLRGSSGAID